MTVFRMGNSRRLHQAFITGSSIRPNTPGNLPNHTPKESLVKHPVRTLSALALVGAAAPAFAASIKDDALSLTIKGNVQIRASLLNDASNTTGDDYDPLRGSNGSAEFARFEVRRARFGVTAKYGTGWVANLTMRAEKNDQAVNAGGNEKDTPAANAASANQPNGRPVQLYYANLAKVFTMDGGVKTTIKGGLDKAFNVESITSSSTFLFPTDSIVKEKVEQRGVGIAVLVESPFLNAGIDWQNNSSGPKDTEARNDVGNEDTNGYYFSGRIEFSPGADFMPAKRQESYCGKEGTHLVIGFDASIDTNNLSDNNNVANYLKTKTVIYGPDALVHWNGLTALVEYRWRTISQDTVTAAAASTTAPDVKATIFNIQGAYAIPVSDIYIEPAIGYAIYNGNKDVTALNNYGGGSDNGTDGKTLNIGVNFYWDGHNSKTSIAYQNWKPESGEAEATIIRVQQQLNF
jgi:hypothetical protein